jgi:hypothetical protein
MVWADLVADAIRVVVPGLHRGMFDGRARPALGKNNAQLLTKLTRSGEAKARCERRMSKRSGYITST